MCCDTCPRYLECEEQNELKDDCCRQCLDYEYCQGEELNYEKESMRRRNNY